LPFSPQGFDGVVCGFLLVVLFAAGAVLDGAAAVPTVKYFRILSSRFLPMPRMACKSPTLLKGPYDLRISRIFSAVDGPIPGTFCNSAAAAKLMFTGFGGGFFFANVVEVGRNRSKTTTQAISFFQIAKSRL
jgi:hypothetical protein